jgi:hypothetical protein
VRKLLFILTIFPLFLVACGGGAPTAQQEAQQEAAAIVANAEFYIPRNGLELRNYNWRQEVGDDPTTILWCTFVFPMANIDPITVPIIGKLTSGGKRPFPTEQVQYGTGNSTYNPELPGSDGMFGSSGEYRYGFGPGGRNEYYDFYNLSSFCTTMPTVFQTNETTIMFETDAEFVAATAAAQQALQSGNPELARDILQEVIGGN